MAFKEPKYKYNQAFLKNYDNSKLKLTRMKCVRNSDIEVDDEKHYSEKCSVNDEKTSDNISRAKSRIFDYAYCNPWQYFITLTLDPKKYDRSDLEKFHKDLSKFFSNYGRNHSCKISYLLVPEKHSDGKTWHLHGLINGLPPESLSQFKIGDKMGKKIADRVLNGYEVYNWNAYSKKFGFCSLEPVRNREAVAKYITKYINKELGKSVKELNAHLYYHSRGLKLPEVMKKGSMSCNIEPYFSSDYCAINWLDYSPETLEQLSECFF